MKEAITSGASDQTRLGGGQELSGEGDLGSLGSCSFTKKTEPLVSCVGLKLARDTRTKAASVTIDHAGHHQRGLGYLYLGGGTPEA